MSNISATLRPTVKLDPATYRRLQREIVRRKRARISLATKQAYILEAVREKLDRDSVTTIAGAAP